jgi:hypothetical protein
VPTVYKPKGARIAFGGYESKYFRLRARNQRPSSPRRVGRLSQSVFSATPHMNNHKDAAFVVSVHDDTQHGATRINLKWIGNYKIFDFELDCLGKILNCETETENAGWVIVKPSPLLRVCSLPPSQSGPAILRCSDIVRPGDAMPSRSRTEYRIKPTTSAVSEPD